MEQRSRYLISIGKKNRYIIKFVAMREIIEDNLRLKFKFWLHGGVRRLSISARVSEQVKTIISTLLNTEYVESDPRLRRKYRVGRRLSVIHDGQVAIDDRAKFINCEESLTQACVQNSHST